ncbi:hypothetical protein [Streptomyces sp. RerS4]|uniref:hypothetical protein n=1 Tax=Streptomyces sp. RerS4 TaxID=2942449 RepID=UPI00201BBC35|nr:hypothetical protein [Streptomyces sp. RerS4]UQW99143.1 hypothetical protein M4D82_00255 [Streptomyces sp. RerS4]
MGDALRIDTDGAVVTLSWGGEASDRQDAVRTAVGGASDRAVYHRRVDFWVHGNGAGDRLPMNLSAWVLASLWRGELPYGLYGPVVVTGPQGAELSEDMAQQVLAVCAAVVEVRQEWVRRPPAGESQARAELMAAAKCALLSPPPTTAQV